MVLNPFARRRFEAHDSVSEERAEPAPVIPVPGVEPADPQTAPRSRRGSRGGRGRGRSGAAAAAASTEPEAPEAKDLDTLSEPAPAAGTPRPRRSRGGRARSTAAEQPEVAAAPETAPQAEAAPSTRRSRPAKSDAAAPQLAVPDLSALAAAIEQQAREIQSLRKVIEAREAAPPPTVAASGLRVGVFVDAANVEKGREERRISIEWARVLRHLSEGRRLARAVAYAPISDDPGVSIETQRFVEPFLDHGFRVVTKPLKRFQGGAIKANLDIEIALDVIQMLDRLDVVCLVSGDGDFEALVEAVQSHGVRVEVASFLHNTAANLRNAADEFIDLSRLREGVNR